MKLYCELCQRISGLSILFMVLLQRVTGKPLQADDCIIPSGCSARNVARYTLTLETLWSRDAFYKQYPLYRPHAQWSKLVGRSHNDDYTMWSLGQLAQDPIKDFVENSASELLDEEIQGSHGILDAFYTLHIPQGVGTVTSDFLVDPKHPKVSAAARIVPSPDWFVGIDSVQLCQGQSWIPEITFDLDPLDAGTDQGYTYTSPNWPETPPKPISTITSSVPNHPANSFRYPELSELPRIARITLRQVELVDIYVETRSNGCANDDARAATNPLEREQLKPTGQDIIKPIDGDNKSAPVGAKGPTSRPTSKVETKEEKRERRRRKKKLEKKRKERQRLLLLKKQKELERLDCILSEWSDWNVCSKTCGYGHQMRTRTVTQREQNGGIPCDDTTEERICGSMKNCEWNHFSISNWGAGI